MKKKLLRLLSIILLCSSCMGGSGYIELSRTRFDFNAEGGQEHISSEGIWSFDGGGEITESGWNQTATSSREEDSDLEYLTDKWVTAVLDHSTGDIIVTVSPNEQSNSRIYEFAVTCADYWAYVKIYQKGKP